MKQRKREQNIDRDGMTEAEPLRDSERPGLKGRFRGTDRATGEMGMERQSEAQIGWRPGPVGLGAKPAQESRQEGEMLGEVAISLPPPNELVLDDPSGYVCVSVSLSSYALLVTCGRSDS